MKYEPGESNEVRKLLTTRIDEDLALVFSDLDIFTAELPSYVSKETLRKTKDAIIALSIRFCGNETGDIYELHQLADAVDQVLNSDLVFQFPLHRLLNHWATSPDPRLSETVIIDQLHLIHDFLTDRQVEWVKSLCESPQLDAPDYFVSTALPTEAFFSLLADQELAKNIRNSLFPLTNTKLPLSRNQYHAIQKLVDDAILQPDFKEELSLFLTDMRLLHHEIYLNCDGANKDNLLQQLTEIFISLPFTDQDLAERQSGTPYHQMQALRRLTSPGLFRTFCTTAFNSSLLKDRVIQAFFPITFEPEVLYQATLEHALTHGNPSKEIIDYLYNHTRQDEGPAKNHSRREEMFHQGLKLRYRAANFVDGFAAWQFAGKGIRNEFSTEVPLLVRVAKALKAKNILKANASHVGLFPGPGYRLSELDIFAALPELELRGPSIMQSSFVKSIRQLYPESLATFRQTTFTFLRGAIIVENPHLAFEVDSPNVRLTVPMALILFNEHFRLSPKDGAVLVPQAALSSILSKDIFVDPDDVVGYAQHKDDICKLGEQLSYSSLVRECQRLHIPLPPANILSGSTIGGSLIKAFPPESNPYFFWERTITALPDKWNHRHFYYVFRFYDKSDDGMTLEDLAKGHDALFRVGSQAMDYLELLEILTSQYLKGLEPSSSMEISDDSSLPEQSDSFEQWVDPRNRRMLQEAYLWHTQKLPQNLSNYPILSLGSFFTPATPLKKSFQLDTRTMELRSEDGNSFLCEFSEDGEPTKETIKAWQEMVVGPYFNGNHTLRFFHRNLFSR